MSRDCHSSAKPLFLRYLTLAACCLCLLALLLPVTPAKAAAISLKQANEIAEQATGGRVVRTESATVRGKAMYRVRVVHDGRIQDLLIDASNGKLVDPLKGDKNNENSGGRR